MPCPKFAGAFGDPENYDICTGRVNRPGIKVLLCKTLGRR